jgi:hypothetical protein
MNTTCITVWSVKVTDRMDGLYLFVNEAHAEMFRTEVEAQGGEAFVTEEPLNASAEALIDAERDA